MVESIVRKAERIINHHIDLFLQEIEKASRFDYLRVLRTEHAGFPILFPANREYYEYRYYERYLEWKIRDHLVNTVLIKLLKNHGLSCVTPPNRRNYVNHSNGNIEDVFPFEFIVFKDRKYVGIRYTSLVASTKDLRDLLKRYNLDHIEVIDWSNADSLESNTIFSGVVKSERDKVHNITLHNFFIKYLSEDEYILYLSKMRDAVEKASHEIGFQTIPILTTKYLGNFRTDLLSILSAIDYQSLEYQPLTNDPSFVECTKGFPSDDKNILTQHFISHRYYQSLIGTADFARSFITSEYLFRIFQLGGQFDFSTIVLGYLKSIEQLSFNILKITMKTFRNDPLWIKSKKYKEGNPNFRRNPKTKQPQVRLDVQFDKVIDTSLASMMWCMHDDVHGWRLSETGREIVHNCFQKYIQECRNEHLHKDNFYDFESVMRIRNNTLLMFYYLLGGYKLYDDPEENRRALCIIDDSFDCLYNKLASIPRSVHNFIIQFKDQPLIKAIRLFHQDAPIYDEFGSLQKSSVKFVKVDVFDLNEFESVHENLPIERVISVDIAHIPEKIWYVKPNGEKVLVKW